VRVVCVALVRNEADIIEAFVRTNLVLVEAMHVMVHRSTDGTREILAALAGEGLPLRLSDIDEEAFRQEFHTTVAAREAFRNDGADFVVPLDADEFLRVADRPTLERSLASIPPRLGGAMPWLTYVPTAADRPSGTALQRLEHRFRMSPTEELDLDYCKAATGAWFAGQEDARFIFGNHAVFANGEHAAALVPNVAVCHYPVRSGDQLARKAALGWLALLAAGRDVERTPTCDHWHRIFTSLKERGTLNEAEIRAFLETYVPPASRRNELVLDPLPHRVDEERYARMQRPQSLLQALLERSESLAKLKA
jgi:hypothetical protein